MKTILWKQLQIKLFLIMKKYKKNLVLKFRNCQDNFQIYLKLDWRDYLNFVINIKTQFQKN